MQLVADVLVGEHAAGCVVRCEFGGCCGTLGYVEDDLESHAVLGLVLLGADICMRMRQHYRHVIIIITFFVVVANVNKSSMNAYRLFEPFRWSCWYLSVVLLRRRNVLVT